MTCFVAARNSCLVLLLAALTLPTVAQDPFGDDPFAKPPARKTAPAKKTTEEAKEKSDKPDDKKQVSDKESKDKVESDLKKLNDKLDELEKKIEDEKKLAQYGLGAVREYSEELTQEYLQNKDSLDNGELEPKTRKKLELNQKRISLYLWELQRVGPDLANNNRYDQNSARMQLSKLMRENRELAKNPQLMKRITDLMRKSMESLSSRMHTRVYEFYFVQPTEKPDAKPAQGANPPAPRLANALNRLLKITYVDGQLALDREHWEKPFGGIKLSTVTKEVEHKLKEYGVNLDAKSRRRPTTPTHPLGVLVFENLQHEIAKYGGSRSSSNSTNEWRRSCSANGVDARLMFRESLFDFSLRGRKGRGNTFNVLCDDANTLKVTGIEDERVFVLTQKKNGKIHYADIKGEETTSITGESFAELYAQHPQVVEEKIFPYLKELGFDLPPTRFAPEFVSRVVVALTEVTPETKNRYLELLDELRSNSFSRRESATRELEKNINKYLPLVLESNRQDELSKETRDRLKLVLQQYENEWQKLDGLISKMGLPDDPEYLVGLLPVVGPDHQNLVFGRLEKTTSQQFGTDTKAWQAWLARERDNVQTEN